MRSKTSPSGISAAGKRGMEGKESVSVSQPQHEDDAVGASVDFQVEGENRIERKNVEAGIDSENCIRCEE